MKFGVKNARERAEGYRKWHKWFAWRPVRVGAGDWRWLEVVMRKRECDRLAPTNCGWKYLPKFKSSYDNPDIDGLRVIRH